MNRQWVHISPDPETAVQVGRRHGCPVVLRIRARDFVRDGHGLYRSANGVWQAKFVPPAYFEIHAGKEGAV
jgi:putative RNA 2'-phosphotransferase